MRKEPPPPLPRHSIPPSHFTAGQWRRGFIVVLRKMPRCHWQDFPPLPAWPPRRHAHQPQGATGRAEGGADYTKPPVPAESKATCCMCDFQNHWNWFANERNWWNPWWRIKKGVVSPQLGAGFQPSRPSRNYVSFSSWDDCTNDLKSECRVCECVCVRARVCARNHKTIM